MFKLKICIYNRKDKEMSPVKKLIRREKFGTQLQHTCFRKCSYNQKQTSQNPASKFQKSFSYYLQKLLIPEKLLIPVFHQLVKKNWMEKVEAMIFVCWYCGHLELRPLIVIGWFRGHPEFAEILKLSSKSEQLEIGSVDKTITPIGVS